MLIMPNAHQVWLYQILHDEILLVFNKKLIWFCHFKFVNHPWQTFNIPNIWLSQGKLSDFYRITKKVN